MFNEISNVLEILKLIGIGENIEIDYKEAISIKYPCVNSWLDSMESNTVIRRYYVLFQKNYLDELHKITNI
jgi:hypothetical protein